MSKVILTDVDDAILNWSDPFQEWALKNTDYRPSNRLQECENIEAWLGCTYEETRDFIQRFNKDPDIWPNFEPLPHAVEVVKRLHEEEGYKFVALTACDTDDWTYQHRRANLHRVFGGAFDTLHCVGLSQKKTGHLTRYRGTYWIEDKWSHAVDGADVGHTPFLMEYGHSRGKKDVRIRNVQSWLQIEEHIYNDRQNLLRKQAGILQTF